MTTTAAGDDLINTFIRRGDVSPKLKAMFEMYNRQEFEYLRVDSYHEAFERLRDDPSLFLFGNTKLARHHMNSEPVAGFSPYVYERGFQSTTHVVFGKGNPFRKIFDSGMFYVVMMMPAALRFRTPR